jgi:hypothetical protein
LRAWINLERWLSEIERELELEVDALAPTASTSELKNSARSALTKENSAPRR